MLVAVACVLGLETAVVGLLVPWPVVHVLDLCAVVQVLAVMATWVTRPHFVGRGALVLHHGPSFELALPLRSIDAVSVEGKSHQGRTLQLHGRDEVSELNIVVGNRTNVCVELAEPITVVLPNGARGDVERVRFRADDATAAISAIRSAIERRETPAQQR
jgi:hypothetical protein